MKKLLTILTIFSLIFTLASCGGGDVTVDMDALQSTIEGGGLFVDTLAEIDNGVVKGIIGVDTALCSSARYFIGSGNTGEQYGLFVCNTDDDAKTIAEQLEARQAAEHATYESYSPEGVERIDNAVIKQAGVYVAFVIADNYDAAADIVNEAFKG